MEVNDIRTELFIVIGLISTTGAIGGIASGMVNRTKYHLQLPGKSLIEVGFIGDALLGIVASWSVFTFASTFMGLDLKQVLDLTVAIKILSFGTISGFAGISLLNKLSHKLVSQIGELQGQVNELQYESRSINYTLQGDFENSIGNLEKAASLYDCAIAAHSENINALIKRGAIAKKLGNPEAALQIAEKVLQIEPNSEVGLYNRACYKAILGHSLGSIINDLDASIRAFEQNRGFAAKDPDFDSIRGETQFQNLVQSEPSVTPVNAESPKNRIVKDGAVIVEMVATEFESEGLTTELD